MTDKIDISRRDEVGKLMAALAVMQTRLKIMIDKIAQTSKEVQRESRELSTAMAKSVEHSHVQNEQTQAVTMATEEFSRSARAVAADADRTAGVAAASKNQVDMTHQSIDRSMQATKQVIKAVNASGEAITELENSVQQIDSITQEIKEIADQTNLLALNAAIEAARAGETGRGFAVVADEVRKLAERTSASTADINRMVTSIQQLTGRAASAMNQAIEDVKVGIGMMQESVTELDRITEASHHVVDHSQQIARTAQEQAAASTGVATRIEAVSAIVEKNTLLARQADGVAKTLDLLSARLHEAVGQFKIT